MKQSSSRPNIGSLEPYLPSLGGQQLPSLLQPLPGALPVAFLHFVRPSSLFSLEIPAEPFASVFQRASLGAHPGRFEQEDSVLQRRSGQSLGMMRLSQLRAGALHRALAVPGAASPWDCLVPRRWRMDVAALPHSSWGEEGLGTPQGAKGCCWGPLVQLPPLPAPLLGVTPHSSGEGKDRALAPSPIPVC